MKNRLIVSSILILLISLSLNSSQAFELGFQSEESFFIGKPMVYTITADSGGQDIGKNGTFIFGDKNIIIDEVEFYDCTFESPSNISHFYFQIAPFAGDLLQKGFKISTSELKLARAIIAIGYPISPGSTWTEKTDLQAKNIQIPGLAMPIDLDIKNVTIKTRVSSQTISVPAGVFDTLLLESTYNGRWIGIPMTLIQRTWLSEDNIAVKRNFEFTSPSPLMIYEIQLSQLSTKPWDTNLDGIVNDQDLKNVLDNFGRLITRVRLPKPDIDGNGIVDITDLVSVSLHYGEKYPWSNQ